MEKKGETETWKLISSKHRDATEQGGGGVRNEGVGNCGLGWGGGGGGGDRGTNATRMWLLNDQWRVQWYWSVMFSDDDDDYDDYEWRWWLEPEGGRGGVYSLSSARLWENAIVDWSVKG